MAGHIPTQMWDYTCPHCGGRGSPDQGRTGNGHAPRCPVVPKVRRV